MRAPQQLPGPDWIERAWAHQSGAWRRSLQAVLDAGRLGGTGVVYLAIARVPAEVELAIEGGCSGVIVPNIEVADRWAHRIPVLVAGGDLGAAASAGAVGVAGDGVLLPATGLFAVGEGKGAAFSWTERPPAGRLVRADTPDEIAARAALAFREGAFGMVTSIVGVPPHEAVARLHAAQDLWVAV